MTKRFELIFWQRIGVKSRVEIVADSAEDAEEKFNDGDFDADDVQELRQELFSELLDSVTELPDDESIGAQEIMP